jgi:hypothetical protein
MPIDEKMINKSPKGGVMIKEQRNLKGIRETNKGGKLKQLATHHLMF